MEYLKMSDQQKETLIELLMTKKAEMEDELKVIMEKKIPIWRSQGIDQGEVIRRINLILEAISKVAILPE